MANNLLQAADISLEISKNAEKKQKCTSCKTAQKEINNYHAGCSNELDEPNPTDRRVKKALSRLVKSAKSENIAQKFKVPFSKNINLRVEHGNGDAAVYIDSSRRKNSNDRTMNDLLENLPDRMSYSKVSFREPIHSYSDDILESNSKELEGCCVEEIEKNAYKEWVNTSPKDEVHKYMIKVFYTFQNHKFNHLIKKYMLCNNA
uniref:uncharacterized protein LOC113475583 n=1 Tax=Ciona intestinalis TaxID=7719 RepID=UPI000EF44CF9|nr:uncharacterized protein LOC113475583 [Ciona intestinalis]|eukprot:XP_026695658.1 uncharacterized protein LOC113475583 [Ciona intestinalis]